jgi:GTP pyrophosphokinase
LAERRADREAYIEAVIARLSAALREAGVEAQVTGRPKHLHSIWRKMRAKNLALDQLFDLRAVRVLVTDVTACYSALGVAHTLWPHIPGEFDDYITKPKSNHYRSLHTAVIGPDGRTLEIQIRTDEMHAHAEYGVAAHWRYKEGAEREDRDEIAKIAWLRQLLEWRGDEDAGDTLEPLDGELGADRVYVVTPRGEVLDLAAGATALDFAYHVHTDVGHRCRGAKANGVIVPLTRPLKSGEQIEVLTTRSGSPSRDWLNPDLGYLRTGRARAKVRQWFKQRDFDKNLADGQEVFSRALRRLGVQEPDRKALAERFKYPRFQDLLAAVGRGDVSVGQLAAALQQAGSAKSELPVAPAAPTVRPARPGDVVIDGVGQLLTQLAQCCKPVRPEPIIGFITRGRGVSIHRRDCANMLRLEQDQRERVLEVSWGEATGGVYAVEVEVLAYDRQGLLRDVTQVVANEKLNVTELGSHEVERDQIARIFMRLEVRDLQQLSRVLDRIGQLSNVVEARRIG